MSRLKYLVIVVLTFFIGFGLTACGEDKNKIYTITYIDTKDSLNENPVFYTKNTETIILKDLESTEDFEFLGWYNGETKVTKIVKGTSGHLTLIAKWEGKLLTINKNKLIGVTSRGKNNTRIEIPNGITSINEDAFYYCNKLQEIIIPASVMEFGNHAFYNCNSLTNVYYTGTLDDWCNVNFNNMDSNPMSCAKHFYMKNADGEYYELTEIKIPDSITEIKDYTFYGFNNVTKVTIPDNVTSIGNCAFYGCNIKFDIHFISNEFDEKTGFAIFEVDLNKPTKLSYKIDPSFGSGYSPMYAVINFGGSEENRSRFRLEDGFVTILSSRFEEIIVKIEINGFSDNCIVRLKKK